MATLTDFFHDYYLLRQEQIRKATLKPQVLTWDPTLSACKLLLEKAVADNAWQALAVAKENAKDLATQFAQHHVRLGAHSSTLFGVSAQKKPSTEAPKTVATPTDKPGKSS